MNADMSAVAIGAASNELSANILRMGRFFEDGVPADNETCKRMMQNLSDDALEIPISEEFYVEIELAAWSGNPEDASLEALFYEKGGRKLGTITQRPSLEGFRQFVRDVRAAARALRDTGLCTKCPTQSEACMRLPHASYCGACCWKVAILG